MTYSLIIRDIAVTMDDKSIKKDLMKTYVGVEKVTRMFYQTEDGDYDPKTSVQVDFTVPTDFAKICRDGSIVFAGICRRAYPARNSSYQRSNRTPTQNRQDTTQSFSEEDLLNIFEEQKKALARVLSSFEDKLHDAITLQ